MMRGFAFATAPLCSLFKFSLYFELWLRGLINVSCTMKIVERDLTGVVAQPPSTLTTGENSTSGFPAVPLLQKNIRTPSDTGGRKTSLFALSQRSKISPRPQHSEPAPHRVSNAEHQQASDSLSIHKENLQKLASMSTEEILRAQRELHQSLDPKMIDFLKSRRRKKTVSFDKLDSNEEVEAPNFHATPNDPHANNGECVSVLEGGKKNILTSRNDSEEQLMHGMEIKPPTNVVNTACGDGGVVYNDVGEVSSDVGVASREVGVANSADSSSKLMQQITDDLPINPVQAASRWLNMDKVEVDKLQWMTRVPDPPSVTCGEKNQHTARFSFTGELLPINADLPVHSGLYHHGEEPQRAGYTINELYTLSRSSVQQQRVTALNTLCNILQQNAIGVFDDVISPPLLTQLMDADLMFLLRFAVDDNSTAVITAALKALAALVCNMPDEACLDRVWAWPGGDTLPLLAPPVSSSSADLSRNQRDQLNDQQLSRLDIVESLIRTDFLLRFTYILEVVRPGAEAVIHGIRVICRCVQHSRRMAVKLLQTGRLVNLLFTEFLPVRPPHAVSGVSCVDDVYGVPSQQLLKLFRLLASHGKQLAGQLITACPNLPDVLLGYMSLDVSECGLPVCESLKVTVESYRLWYTLLQSGFTQQQFIVFYPVLMRQLQYLVGAVNVCSTDEYRLRFCLDLAACLFRVCESVIRVVQRSQSTTSSYSDINDCVVEWHQMAGVFELILVCTRKWLSQITSSTNAPTDSALHAVSCALSCVRSYHVCSAMIGDHDRSSRSDRLVSLCRSVVEPFITSSFIKRTISQLRTWSVLMCDRESGAQRQPECLPSLGAVCWQADSSLVPLLMPSSGVPLLLSLTDLLLSFRALCLSPQSDCYTASSAVTSSVSSQEFTDTILMPDALEVIEKITAALLNTETVCKYLHQISTHHQLQQLGSWFSRYEIQLISNILLLAPSTAPMKPVLFSCACRLVSCCCDDQQSIVSRLLTKVIFSSRFCSGVLSPMSASDCFSVYHPILCTDSLSPVYESTARYSSGTAGTCVPADWWYLPLVHAYQLAGISRDSTDGVNSSGGGDCTESDSQSVSSERLRRTVCCCLCTVSGMHQLAPDVLRTVSDITHFSRICLVFLAGEDLFLDDSIRPLLEQTLRHLFCSGHFIDLATNVPGLSSFSDLFTELIVQFGAVSYCDWLFGAVLLVALDTRQPLELRRTLLMDKPFTLRSITTQTQQLLVPVEQMLSIRETDTGVIHAYKHALAQGLITEKRNPALFQIASSCCSAAMAEKPDKSAMVIG